MGEPSRHWAGVMKVLEREWLRPAVEEFCFTLKTASSSGFLELVCSLAPAPCSPRPWSAVSSAILLPGLERMSSSFFILVSLSLPPSSLPILAIMLRRGSMYFSSDLILSRYSLSSCPTDMGLLTLLGEAVGIPGDGSIWTGEGPW